MSKIILNPDVEYVDEIYGQLRRNNGYCPQKLERTKDTVCMCKEFREMTAGMCRCGLYIKEEE